MDNGPTPKNSTSDRKGLRHTNFRGRIMSYQVKSMPDCCWKYLRGVNQGVQSELALKKELWKAFQSMDRPAIKLPGALLFCGAYGGDTIPAHMIGDDGVKTKARVLENLEFISAFFEKEELGEIVELPNFYSGLHDSNITGAMLLIDAPKFQIALKRWRKEEGSILKIIPEWL